MYEKVHFLYLFGHGWISFLIIWLAVVGGLIGFIEVWKRLWFFAQQSWLRDRDKK